MFGVIPDLILIAVLASLALLVGRTISRRAQK